MRGGLAEKDTDQIRSVAQSCPTLCDPMNHSTPSLPVHHQLQELTQTHVHRVSDAIQPSHPLLSPSPPALDLSQYQGLFNESALCIRWSKYWSFSFNISPSNEYSGWFPLGLTGLISFFSTCMIFFKLVFLYFPNIIRCESKPTRSYCPVLLDDSSLGRNFEDLFQGFRILSHFPLLTRHWYININT